MKNLPRMSRALFALALGFALSPLGAVEIVGHRGASHDAPENSLTSMRLAWQQQADGIETDVHLSKDGHLVVMHDADLKRTGGREGKIVELPWAELQRVDIGQWKGAQFAGEKLPTLEAIFATIPAGKFILTEIKIHDLAILPELEKAAKASGKTAVQLRFHTFYYEVAKALKEKFPTHEVDWLCSYAKDKTTGALPQIDDLIQKAKAAHLDGLNLQAMRTPTEGVAFPIDAAMVQKIHAAGLKIYPWTIDNAEVARKLAATGVDGIITNRPAWLRAELAR